MAGYIYATMADMHLTFGQTNGMKLEAYRLYQAHFSHLWISDPNRFPQLGKVV
jgi:hypothetical protein